MRIERFLFFVSLVAIVIFVIFPYLAIKINNLYSLPVYEFPLSKLIGITFILAGIYIVSYCVYTLFLKPQQDIPLPIHAPKKFVIEGLYRYVRNPMYVGDFMIFLGEFLFFGHLLLLVYLITAVIFIHLMVIFKEEKALEKKFGKEYLNYKTRVPRWIPYIIKLNR